MPRGNINEELEYENFDTEIEDEALTPRWDSLDPVKEQNELWNAGTRFRVCPAGRRSGKTELAKRFILLGDPDRGIEGAFTYTEPYDDGWFVLAAPTHGQAKRIFWRDLKNLIPRWMMRGSPRESDLMIRLINGVEVQVIGLDKPERAEGRPIDAIVLDEYGNMKPEAWTEHIRPGLATRGREGWAWLIGVPEGRNHYYDVYKYARDSKDPEWSAHTWPSALVVAKKEIEQAMRDMDELTFQQEFHGSFVNFTGRAYYSFGEHNLHRLEYDEFSDLVVCFDFNVSPGVAVICQEQTKEAYRKIGTPMRGKIADVFTAVIGEVYIPRHSNTPRVVTKIIEDWGNHKGRVLAYGDATGGAKGTSSVEGSDWDIIDRMMKSQFGSRYVNRVPRGNPRERVRVNSVNSRCKAADGTISLLLDQNSASFTQEDFEGVRTLEGGSGEIDKDSDKMLTHLTDAIGYYLVEEHPIGGPSIQVY